MRIIGRGAILATITAVVLLASACGSGSGAEEGDPQITLRDFQIDLSPATLTAGDVTFSASNAGPSVHEFEVFSVPDGVDPNDLSLGDNVAEPESQGLEVIDEVEDIAPSTTASLTVSLEPGTYALICNLAGHYEQGMHVAFTVG